MKTNPLSNNSNNPLSQKRETKGAMTSLQIWLNKALIRKDSTDKELRLGRKRAKVQLTTDTKLIKIRDDFFPKKS